MAPVTLDQEFVGQLCTSPLLPQDSNSPTMCLTTPHYRTNTTTGAQMGTSTFCFLHNESAGHEEDKCALSQRQQKYWCCTVFCSALSLCLHTPSCADQASRQLLVVLFVFIRGKAGFLEVGPDAVEDVFSTRTVEHFRNRDKAEITV